jgi:superfamily I DNA/RNA helicase
MSLLGELLPSPAADGYEEAVEAHLAEERRLFHVAATRARDLLCISFVQGEPHMISKIVKLLRPASWQSHRRFPWHASLPQLGPRQFSC